MTLSPPPANSGEKINTQRPERRLLRIKQIIHGDPTTNPPTLPLVSVGRTTLLEWEAAGKFPASIRIGNCRFYYSDLVQKWIDQGGKWSEEDNKEAA